MMEIYMIRHGETMWNQQHRLQGRKDIPLNDVGLAGARIAAEALKDIHFDRVFSSPLVTISRRSRSVPERASRCAMMCRIPRRRKRFSII